MNETSASATPNDFFKDFLDDRFTDGADRNVFLGDLTNDSLTSDFFEQSTSTSSPESERSGSSSADGLEELDQMLGGAPSSADTVMSDKQIARQSMSGTPGPLFELADGLGGFNEEALRDGIVMPPTPAATETRTSFDGDASDTKKDTVSKPIQLTPQTSASTVDSHSTQSASKPSETPRSAPHTKPMSAPSAVPVARSNAGMAPPREMSYTSIPQNISLHARAPMLQLNLLGIPTKSRVETQIRLGIQLVEIVKAPNGQNVEVPLGPRFRWLKLPTWSMAKEKLKVKNRKDAPSTIDPRQIVFLECRVVKSSAPYEDVSICHGCIIRERKRSQRKKDVANREVEGARNSKHPPKQQEWLPLPDEERKIMVFNCPELLELKNGQAVAPTRVTCYCRHHKEKDGFRMIITLKDAAGTMLASTTSDIILITDDHKTTPKVEKGQREEYAPVKGMPHLSSSALLMQGPPPAEPTVEPIVIRTQSNAAKKAIAPVPAPAKSLPAIAPASVPMSANPSQATSIGSRKRKSDSAATQPATGKLAKVPSSLSMTRLGRGELVDNAGQQQDRRVSEDKKLKRSPSQDSLMQFMNFQINGSEVSSPAQSLRHLPSGVTSPTFLPELERFSSSPQQRLTEYQTTSVPHFTSMHPAYDGSACIEPPAVSRLIPSEGPLRGGIEVTILGSGFYPGLTAMFGDVPAVPTHCWSPTTMVCVLPPATNAGPVLVSFKEFPTHLQHTAVKHFTYVDETDRALMELALQVIGLKTSGKLENARDVALRICGSSAPSGMVDANMESMPVSQLRAALGVTEFDDLEDVLCACLRYMEDLDTIHPTRISHRAKTGHTMLHMATLQGYTDLVQTLIDLGANPNVRDRNGYTSLHLAASAGNNDIAAMLVADAHASVTLLTSDGKTAYDIAALSDDPELLAILDPWSLDEAQTHAHMRRLSRSSSAASGDSIDTITEDWEERGRLSQQRSVTQPSSRAASPVRAAQRSLTVEPTGRQRSRSLGSRSDDSSADEQDTTAELRRFSQSLALSIATREQKEKEAEAEKGSLAHTAENLTQLQQSWLDFIASTSPWLHRTISQTPYLPGVLKTHNMPTLEMPQTIAAFQAMIPLPQRLMSSDGVGANRASKAGPGSAQTDATWLQSLVSHLGAPPTYQEATASIPILRDIPALRDVGTSSSASSSVNGGTRTRAASQETSISSARDEAARWWHKRTIPLRSQGRIEEMSPEEMREQARRSRRKSDTMMTFFWLPCFCLFIVISMFRLFFDKLAAYVLSL